MRNNLGRDFRKEIIGLLYSESFDSPLGNQQKTLNSRCFSVNVNTTKKCFLNDHLTQSQQTNPGAKSGMMPVFV